MIYIDSSQRFECVGNRFKNPDLIRFFTNFAKYYNHLEGSTRVKSSNGGGFFSQEYLDFLTHVLGTENGLLEFLAWLRDELLTREHIRHKISQKYTPRQFVEILFLLFHNQKNLQFSTNKPLIVDIFSQKVHDVLQEINSALSQSGIDVFRRLEETIDKGFFPISSQGELLLYITALAPGKAEFLTFPLGSRVITNKSGAIIEILYETDSTRVNEEDEGLENFLDWFLCDVEFETMNAEELRLRLSVYEKWRNYLEGNGQILSQYEYEAYLIEYDTNTENLHDADSLQEISQETKRYLDAHFKAYIKSIIDRINKLLRRKAGFKVIK